MLIARIHTYVKLCQIRGQQFRYTGHVINFCRDICLLFIKLPRLPREYDVIILKSANTNEDNRLQ